ncbi:MAG TPA: hypothetical protein VJ302_37855 [Blastocatellia bacterium]|nr:hypothetical protein [Blastocatellia bacterium]
MKIRIYQPLISVAVLALTTLGSAQTPQVVRWQESEAHSTQSTHQNLTTKQVLVDGATRITVAASIRNRRESFVVELKVHNHGSRELQVRPEEVQLQMVRPKALPLVQLPAKTVARRAIDSAYKLAARIDSRALPPTKSLTEFATTTSSYMTGQGTNGPIYVQVPETYTRIRSEVDYDVQRLAEGEARRIRAAADADQRQILNTDLQTTLLEHNSAVAGRVYFDRQSGVQELLLRVPLGNLTVEIPFKPVRKCGFLKRKIAGFE